MHEACRRLLCPAHADAPAACLVAQQEPRAHDCTARHQLPAHISGHDVGTQQGQVGAAQDDPEAAQHTGAAAAVAAAALPARAAVRCCLLAGSGCRRACRVARGHAWGAGSIAGLPRGCCVRDAARANAGRCHEASRQQQQGRRGPGEGLRPQDGQLAAHQGYEAARQLSQRGASSDASKQPAGCPAVGRGAW